MADPKFIPEVARALFSTLSDSQIHLVYIHPNGLKVTGVDFGTDVEKAVEGARIANESGFNVYWTVNQCLGGLHRKPAKSDITAARFVHVDIDPPKSGGAFDKPAIIEALSGLETAPSFVIDSGGGLQAFWRLDEPCANLASIEHINLQVRDYFDADACQNIDRLMRVPGTVNWPDKRKMARGRVPKLAVFASEDDGTVYEPQTLTAAFPPPLERTVNIPAQVNAPANVHLTTPDDLGLGPLDPIRIAISEPPGSDRSGDGLACARLMANEGYDDATIMGALLNPANPVSAHYLDQRDPKRAAARSIALVRSDGPKEGDRLGPDPDHQYFHLPTLIANIIKRTGGAKPQAEPKWSVPSGLPAWRRDLGNGGLAMFVDHVIATAPSPQPFVTLGAGIAMFGAIAGRRYASPTNLRTNIYSIGIADSGAGKDHPLRATTKLMIDAGLQKQIGGSKIASGSGLITDITNNPAILYPLDEVGFLISAAADRRRSPKHIVDIMDNLTEFYSMADGTFLGTSYADQKEKPRQVIEQPCLSMFGVTTPGVFWGSLKSDNVMDGSLARMVIFESECQYPDPQHDVQQAPFPGPLIELAKAVSTGAAGHNAFPLGEGASIIPKPFRVPYADDTAAQTAREMREHQTRRLREHEGSNLTSILARMAENAAKLALVKAISDNPSNPKITRADLEWGQLVSTQSVDTLMRAIKDRVADNDAEAKLKRVHKIIADAGSAGIAHEDLVRMTRFLGSRRALNDALDFLAEGASIRLMDMPRADGKTGKGRRVYFDID